MNRERAVVGLLLTFIVLAATVLVLTSVARDSKPVVPILDQMCAEARDAHPVEGCW